MRCGAQGGKNLPAVGRAPILGGTRMRGSRRIWLRRAAAAAMVAFALGYVPYHVYGRSGLARALQMRRDLVALKTRNDDLRRENERLAREAHELRSDMRAIERVARTELGWVRPGELVFDFSSGVGGGKPGTGAAATTP